MTQFKGTPGPWIVTEIDDDDLSEQSSTMIVAGDTVIACVGPSVHTLLGIDKNNAHLIAAAPELLETLTVTLDEIGHWLSQQKPELRQKLVSIINKATGETK